jgi:hypothetical protein
VGGPPQSEALRLHMIAEHHWPQVSRHYPTGDTLHSLHADMDDTGAHSDLVARIRAMLGMPVDVD